MGRFRERTRRISRPRVAFLVLAATLSAAILLAMVTASGSETAGSARRLGQALRRARRFSGFPLYWDGARLGRLPLTGVDVGADHDGIGYTFTYGDCAGGDEGGCAPPLEVQITPLCNRLPREIGLHLARLMLRGAPTSAAEAGSDNGGDLSIYTRRVTITVFGYTPRLDLRAVAALRGLNSPARGIGPADPLPAPSKRVFVHGC